MRGRYVEKYLLERTFFDFRDLSVRRFSARPSFGIGVVSSKKRRFFARARYVERILKRYFESLGLIIGYIRCQFLQSIFDSSAVIPACSSLSSCVILPAREDSFKQDVLSDLIRSSKDFISTQVFHRGSRKLSRSFGGSASSSNRSNTWVSYLFDWFSPKTRFVGDTISEGKLDEDNERNRRRLSFVPTILYKGLTNRIGVDFTRLVAYAFVPFTSLILLYMYK